VTVALIDSSVFCELLAIPSKSSAPAQFRAELKEKSDKGEILLLPMTTIIETGNHIGQCSTSGATRRHLAERFVASVEKAIDGEAPFIATPFFDPAEVRKWLAAFPDWTKVSDPRGRGSGLGDLTIVKVWEQQCALNPGHRVYIWSLDQRLVAYDRAPDL